MRKQQLAHKTTRHSARKRRREDWLILVYRYDVRPLPNGVPELFWVHQHRLREAWNHLVEMGQAQREAYRQMQVASSEPVPAEAKRAFRRDWQQRVYAYVQGLVDLPWGDRGHLYDRFLRAHRAWLAGRSAPPRVHSGPLRQVHLHHQITNTGFPVGDLFGGTRRQLALWPDPDETRGRPRYLGRVLVGTEYVRFRLTLHRPFPDGVIVKRIMLLGEQAHGSLWWHRHQAPTRWAWSLAVMLEVPPVPAFAHPRPDRMAAIDLGWRLVEQDEKQTVRIGVLYDGEGAHDLLLPPDLLGRWRFLSVRQEEMDGIVERIKADVPAKPMPAGLSADARAVLASLQSVRLGGLRRLHRACVDADAEHPTTQWLTTWLSRHGGLAREVAGLQQRMLLARREHYRVFAKRLCQDYGCLVLEKWDLRTMAQTTEETPPAVAASQQYRHLVALSEFRQALDLVARKTGTVIERVNPAYTTLECAVCGARVQENTGEQALTCQNGHTWDQDVNAAKNLFARASGLVVK